MLELDYIRFFKLNTKKVVNMCEVCLKRLLNLFKKVRAQTQLSIFCRSNLTSLIVRTVVSC